MAARRRRRRVWKIVGVAVFIGIAAFAVSSLLRSPADETRIITVAGDSMMPTITDGDKVTVRVGATPQRFDIVVYRNLDDPSRTFIGRVVGMPGDRIELRRGTLLINETPAVERYLASSSTVDAPSAFLGDHGYYVLGDNRDNSLDSSEFGAVSEDLILGVVRD